MANKDRKYRVKMNWIFNLEAMHDKLWVIGNDLDEGRLQAPVNILGTDYFDSYDIQTLIDESDDLAWTAKTRLVTGKEYGRIKEIVEWRVQQRYNTCIANGMSERDAGACFEDC